MYLNLIFRKKGFLVLLLFLVYLDAESQNLVVDGGFEKLTKDKSSFCFWKGGGHFHSLSIDRFSKPNLMPPKERISARSGDGFVRFCTGHEIIHGKCKPLTKGHRYRIEVYVGVTRKTARTNAFWIWLYKKGAKKKFDDHIDPPAQLINPKNSFIGADSLWSKIEAEFVAIGDEQVISIGGLTNKPKFKKGVSGPKCGPVLYVDDVSITDITPGFQFETDKPIRLENIFFNTGKSELLPASFAELDKLYEHLEAKPDQKLEIAGHTDNVGQNKANQALSAARAKAVHDYLVGKGIAKERLSYIGFGSTKPVADNATKQGRQQNRRVEVRLVK